MADAVDRTVMGCSGSRSLDGVFWLVLASQWPARWMELKGDSQRHGSYQL